MRQASPPLPESSSMHSPIDTTLRPIRTLPFDEFLFWADSLYTFSRCMAMPWLRVLRGAAMGSRR
jgi:hypothetical protein